MLSGGVYRYRDMMFRRWGCHWFRRRRGGFFGLPPELHELCDAAIRSEKPGVDTSGSPDAWLAGIWLALVSAVSTDACAVATASMDMCVDVQ